MRKFYNKALYFLKSTNKVELFVYLFFFILLVLVFFDQISFENINRKINHVLILFELFLIVTIFSSNLPIVKIPIFHYNHKLMTIKENKIYIFLKTSYFILIFHYIMFSILPFFMIDNIIINVLLFIIGYQSLISRRFNMKDILIIVSLIMFYIIIKNFYVIWLFTFIIYGYTNIIKIDLNNMFNYSILYSNVFDNIGKEHVYYSTTRNNLIKEIDSRNKLFLYICLKYFKYIIIATLIYYVSILLIETLPFNISVNKYKIIFILIFLSSSIFLWTREDHLILNNKIYNVTFLKNQLFCKYVIYLISSVIFYIILTLGDIHYLSFFHILIVIILALNYCLQDYYLRNRSKINFVIDFILFLIIGFII